MNTTIENSSQFKRTQKGLEQAAKKREKEANTQLVVITEINISFIKLVGFLVKLTIAAVPAGIIVFLFWTMLAGFFTSFLTAFK